MDGELRWGESCGGLGTEVDGGFGHRQAAHEIGRCQNRDEGDRQWETLLGEQRGMRRTTVRGALVVYSTYGMDGCVCMIGSDLDFFFCGHSGLRVSFYKKKGNKKGG